MLCGHQNRIVIKSAVFSFEIKSIEFRIVWLFPRLCQRRACFAFPELSCSMTMEAAFLLPIFILSCCLLAGPIRVLDRELCAQKEAESLLMLECSAGILSEKFSDREEDWDGILEIVTEEPIELLFSDAFGISPGDFRIIARRRAWIGREGGAGRAYESDIPEEVTEDDTIVYVAENSARSGRYHLDRNCHYISNKVTAVPASEVGSLRNADGGKYHPCVSCHPGTVGTVYVFSAGDSYHAAPDCSALRSYVTEMTKKEAEERGLSPCSYCLRNYSPY